MLRDFFFFGGASLFSALLFVLCYQLLNSSYTSCVLHFYMLSLFFGSFPKMKLCICNLQVLHECIMAGCWAEWHISGSVCCLL